MSGFDDVTRLRQTVGPCPEYFSLYTIRTCDIVCVKDK